MACCLPMCAQGSSAPVMKNAGNGVCLGFLAALQCLVRMGVLALLVFSLVFTGLGSHRCASCWTRPLGGGRWEHYLCNLWEECLPAHKTAQYYQGLKVVS